MSCLRGDPNHICWRGPSACWITRPRGCANEALVEERFWACRGFFSLALVRFGEGVALHRACAPAAPPSSLRCEAQPSIQAKASALSIAAACPPMPCVQGGRAQWGSHPTPGSPYAPTVGGEQPLQPQEHRGEDQVPAGGCASRERHRLPLRAGPHHAAEDRFLCPAVREHVPAWRG